MWIICCALEQWKRVEKCNALPSTPHNTKKLKTGTRKQEPAKESRLEKCATGIWRWQNGRMRNEKLSVKERYYTWLDPEGLGDWIA